MPASPAYFQRISSTGKALLATAILLAVSLGSAFAEKEATGDIAVEPSPTAMPGTSADSGEAVGEGREPVVADYEGRGADAEWRKAAAERIDQFRKGDLTVVVTDAEGKAIKEAEVAVKLKRHAFRFGTSVSVEFAPEPAGEETSATPRVEMPVGSGFSDEARATYREKLFSLFNTATPQDDSNAMDERMVAWLVSRGFLADSLGDEVLAVPARPQLDALVPPEALWEELGKLAESGRPLVATDYALPVNWRDAAQLQLQADYTRDFFTVLFSHSQVEEISIAGFWAPTTGLRGWALFDENWTVLPVGQTYIDLTTKLWSTDETALTDAAGKVKIRGYLGRYRISVSSGPKTQTVTADLPADGAEVTITLD
jgi:hypothetical protein